MGCCTTWRDAPAKNKWLRNHNTHEWFDFYNHTADLARFCDRYVKGIENGFEHDTPPVRLSLIGFDTVPDVVERPEKAYPVERLKERIYHLDAKNMVGDAQAIPNEAQTNFESHHLTDQVVRCTQDLIPLSSSLQTACTGIFHQI